MNLTKRERTIKYAVYCLLILVASLLQNVGGLWFEIGGARCFFIIPTVVALGIDEDERVATMLGIFAGFLWDMLSAQHMGFNFIILALICYVSSSLVSYLLRATYFLSVAGAILGTIIYVITYWLLFVVIGGSDGSVASLGYFYIPCAIYTSVMAFVIVWILRPLKRKLNKEPRDD